MLKDEPWEEVALFAYDCQNEALNLFPWQEPPCWGDSVDADPDAAKLLQQMLAVGVSQLCIPTRWRQSKQAKRESGDMMIGLTDRQLAIVMEAAKPLPPEKRSLFLRRVEAMLHYRRPSDDNECAATTEGSWCETGIKCVCQKKVA